MTKPLGPDQGEPKTSQLQQFPTVSSWSTLSLKRSALFSLAAAFSEPVDYWVARLCQVTNSSGLGSKQMGPTTGRWSVSKFHEWNEQTILHLPNPPASGSTSLLQCHLTAEAGSCQELNWGLLPTATQDDQTVNSSLASSISVTHHCHHQNHNCNFVFCFFLFLFVSFCFFLFLFVSFCFFLFLFVSLSCECLKAPSMPSPSSWDLSFGCILGTLSKDRLRPGHLRSNERMRTLWDRDEAMFMAVDAICLPGSWLQKAWALQWKCMEMWKSELSLNSFHLTRLRWF